MEKPNVIIFVIDSFRADMCYDKNKKSITNTIDSLIQRGAYFTQAITSCYASIPATASLLTGKYPLKIMTVGDKGSFKLSSKVTTFIDKFVENKYHTYALMPEFFSLMGLTKYFQHGVVTYKEETLASELSNEISKFLETMEKPWILYIHLMELHNFSPPPDEFNDDKYGKNQYEKLVSGMDFALEKVTKKIDYENTLLVLTADHGSDRPSYTPEIEKIVNELNSYNPRITYSLIEKIVNFSPKFLLPIKDKKLLTRALKKKFYNRKRDSELNKIKKSQLSVFEKRIFSNAINPVYNLYDEKFRIPLILAGYGINNHRIINQQVRGIDIFPTIADILNIRDFHEIIQGRSLYPLIKGENVNEVPAQIDSCANWSTLNTTDTLGIRTSKFKYFRHKNNPKKNVELFDLQNDPKEEKNIAAEKLDIVTQMEELISKVQGTDSNRIDQEEKISNENTKQIEDELKRLGYL